MQINEDSAVFTGVLATKMVGKTCVQLYVHLNPLTTAIFPGINKCFRIPIIKIFSEGRIHFTESFSRSSYKADGLITMIRV